MVQHRSHGMHVGRNSAGRWAVSDNYMDGGVLSPDFGTKREAIGHKRLAAKPA